jgi:Ca2+-binding RTX toxin-like protein
MKARTIAARARLVLDRLEDRTTPSVSVVAGNLVITGTAGDDNVVVSRRGDNFRVRDNGVITEVPAASVTGVIQFTGGEGNDGFWNFTRLGTDIDAGAGNDRIYAGYGFDTIDGGAGNDYISAGFDTLGSSIDGGAGADYILGSRGNDTIVTGDADDTARNWAFGLAGNDTITAGAGNDVLSGGFGNDTLNGGAGNDRLYGDFGADTLNGEDGDDYLNGGIDNAADSLTGGAGADTFATNPLQRFLPSSKKDTLVDFTEGEDRKTGGFTLPF